jgi:signal transduction histidine kinase
MIVVGHVPSKVLLALFAVSTVLFVMSISRAPLFAIRGMSGPLVKAFSVALVVVSVVAFWGVPPLRWVSQAGTTVWVGFEFTAAGRALLAALVAGLLSVIVLLRRAEKLERLERLVFLVGFSLVSGMLLLDCLGLSLVVSPVPLATHVGLIWCLMLFAMSLSWHYRLTKRCELVSAELASSKQELSVGYVHLEQMQRELGTKKQLAAVGELAAAIAHEVRNPLAIIVNAAAGLRRTTLQIDDRNTLLGILDEETARLNRLVTDLLRFARPVIIKRASVSISELAKRVEGRLEDNQVLELEIPEDPLLRVVQADASLLRLVFDNLVSNAFQAMPEGGTVRIIVTKDESVDEPFVRIDIVDHGQGMEEQVRVRAIDPFYTTRPSGTGLGLPIVQRIVEAHGGRINIDSAPGHGTTVSLYLPSLASTESDSIEREDITLR